MRMAKSKRKDWKVGVLSPEDYKIVKKRAVQYKVNFRTALSQFINHKCK